VREIVEWSGGGIQAFEIADQLAQSFDVLVEIMFLEDMIQSRVERMRGGAWPSLIVELIAHLNDRQGVDDADASVLHGNLGVRSYRPPAACGGPGRSTTRTGVLQGSPGRRSASATVGASWGVSICAPMVIGDARTQTFATSQPPPDAPRPKLIGLLNGPIQWGDTMWAALTWDTIANCRLAPAARRSSTNRSTSSSRG
jgi:hypothetical protein